MVHLTILVSTMTRRAPQQAKGHRTKRLDSRIQSSYRAVHNDTDNSDRHITPDSPIGWIFLRPRVRSQDCLDPRMSSSHASTDRSSHARCAGETCASDPDLLSSSATSGASQSSRSRIRIAHALRA